MKLNKIKDLLRIYKIKGKAPDSNITRGSSPVALLK
jgi:hypothetical protein